MQTIMCINMKIFKYIRVTVNWLTSVVSVNIRCHCGHLMLILLVFHQSDVCP